MKELKKYQCEVCHTEYADRNDAIRCEEHHVLPKTIKDVFAHPQTAEDSPYPKLIIVEMNDGRIVEYTRSLVK